MAAKTLKMRAEYQMCRTLGHAWDDFIPGPGDPKPAPWGRGFSLRCDRCTTQRHDAFDSRGELSARKYIWPKDYKLAADEKPAIETLRLSLVQEMRAEHAQRMKHRQAAHKTRAPARTARPARRLHAVS